MKTPQQKLQDQKRAKALASLISQQAKEQTARELKSVEQTVCDKLAGQINASALDPLIKEKLIAKIRRELKITGD